jgi:transposase
MPEVITTIGLDLGKNTFDVVGLDTRVQSFCGRRYPAFSLCGVSPNFSRCLIGMEACSGYHHIGCKLSAQGHEVRLISVQYAKPFLKGH